MRISVTGPLADTAAGDIAEQVIRACVHCGMCNATCPTHVLTGDELDGPRGRIYLMKQALEGEPVSRLSQVHLDRCLGCRACETTCPSGVEYHRLYDAAKPAIDQAQPRPLAERLLRWAIRVACVDPLRLALLMAIARPFAPLLPPALRSKLQAPRKAGPLPAARHARRMVLLGGCVQAAAAPRINAAARRVFDRSGIDLVAAPGCCGALHRHTGDGEGARAIARRNIAAWTQSLDGGAEAVVSTASGCAAFVRDYADLLADDPAFAPLARRVGEAVRDPAEILEKTPPTAPGRPTVARVAVHAPCTLRNGPGLADAPARLLARLGFETTAVGETHLCCGSAGAWSLLQPQMAGELRRRKLAALTAGEPQMILSANIGCLMHLAEGARVPVRHWLEAVDDLQAGDA